MSITLDTATGGMRCRIVRQYFKERGPAYLDHDALGEGKEAFGHFINSRQRY